MSGFAVQLTRAAARDLDRLPRDVRDQIAADLLRLRESPFGRPPAIKRLRGFGFPLYRMRTGDYRSLYRIDNGTVTVMRIINRRALERTLRQLRSR